MNEELPKHESEATFSGSEVAAKLIEQRRLPDRITTDEIQVHVPEIGGTEIVLQRHGKYIRDIEDPFSGSLEPASERAQEQLGLDFMTKFIEGIPEAERDQFDVLIVASDTQYEGGGRRSHETAEAVWEGMAGALANAGLDNGRIINVVQPVQGLDGQETTGVPQVEPRLREPQMLANEQFRNFLAEKYKDQTVKFWIAFEEDWHAEERVAAGAEGPDDIADRTLEALNTLKDFALEYHQTNPGRRLLIWAASHYDTISPLVKMKLAGGTKEDVLPVDYGAGISIDVDPEGHATSTISGTTYEVPLAPRG